VPPDTSRRVPPAATTPSVAATSAIPGQVRGDIQVVPDEGTNSLLVRAQPDDWEVVRRAVDALDLRPLQVLIEVLIAEVRRTSELDIGVSGVVRKGGTIPTTGTGTSPTPTPTPGTVGVFGAAGDLLVRITRNGNIDLDLAISALSQHGNVRILSRPVILAQNNQQARILVGSERPFVQVFRSLPTDNGVRDQIVQYRDVGTTLTITPTINPDGYVNLQVQQEVSTATDVQQFGAPVISTREASTYLFVRDGQTAVLGGLVDRQQDKSRGGIRLLSAIPGIGALFGSTRNASSVSELFLFLTPRLVRDDADVDQIREGVRERSELLHDVPVERTAIPPRPPQVP
jgi:general secretion pathway protein D